MTSPQREPSSSQDTETTCNTDFEATLTFQQRALDELNEVVLRQQDELEQLRREVRHLRGEVERAIDLTGADLPPDEKPPHY